MGIKFSIITVSYNSEKTIGQTIESVINQTYTNFEYIIIDGLSSDNTLSIIDQYAQKDNRIKYLSEKDNGIYEAMNKGIRKATGDVISLLNSDDYYENDALEKILPFIPNNTDYYVLYGMIRILKHDMEYEVMLLNHNSLPEEMMMHPGCFVSKSIYNKYLYDTKYRSAADYDLFLRLYQDKSISFIPVYEIITNFRLGGMSSSLISDIETNDIRYKYGYISKRQRNVSNFGKRIKKLLL